MNPRSKSERPLKERLKEAVREEILSAAERVFGERGLSAAKMEEIALGAGVSVGTLYNHFADRQALLIALLEARRAELQARLDEALEGSKQEPFQLQLQQFIGAMMEHLGHHRALFAMLVEEELRSGQGLLRAKPGLKELTARCRQLVERGLEQGALRREDAALYPALLMGFIRGFFSQFAQDEAMQVSPALVEALSRTFLQGAGVSR
jgi:AcrR family transcriptional regulator